MTRELARGTPPDRRYASACLLIGAGAFVILSSFAICRLEFNTACHPGQKSFRCSRTLASSRLCALRNPTRCRRFPLLGVGTVLEAQTCRAALQAGAQFVVTPICRTELVAIAHAANRPIMLGAYSPTEAQLAHDAGADFVKIFPADTLGPGYIKALRAPLPHLRLVPTGGVDLHNLANFLQAGCAAVGVGSSLVSAKILQEANWPELTRRAREFVESAMAARNA